MKGWVICNGERSITSLVIVVGQAIWEKLNGPLKHRATSIARGPSSTPAEVSRQIHTAMVDHGVNIESSKILTIGPKWFERGVKKAINIKFHHPILNRDGGSYNLPAV